MSGCAAPVACALKALTAAVLCAYCVHRSLWDQLETGKPSDFLVSFATTLPRVANLSELQYVG